MKELVNLSNTAGDLQYLLDGCPDNLDRLLQQHRLNGVEMMFAAPWDAIFPAQHCIQGVHLRFWPSWLDFWHGNTENVSRIFPNADDLLLEYGTSSRGAWLDIIRENIHTAVTSGAPYFVFHVTNMRPWELYDRRFLDTDRTVIESAVELLNAVCEEIPEDRLLLFENLWWAGLTLKNQEDAMHLLQMVHHNNCGFMLDTGHLLCSTPQERTEEESIDYILRMLDHLGDTVRYIRGIHLHCSLSGRYALDCMSRTPMRTMREALQYTIDIDRHQPFTSSRVKQIVEAVRPEYLVHEFIPSDLRDWNKKLHIQRHALGLE